MLQAPNPMERVHPLERWARAIESDPDFNIRHSNTCAIAVALRIGLLHKRPDFKDPSARHDDSCPCRLCCDWPKLAGDLDVSVDTLERTWSGENGSRARAVAATMRLLKKEPALAHTTPIGERYKPRGFA